YLVMSVCLAARLAGAKAYLVGGVVRDLILNQGHDDLDVVVEGDVSETAKAVSLKLNARLVQHHQFKTATVILEDNGRLDFACARKEAYPHPGSLPVVSGGSLNEDLFRRDFTINAMAISINDGDFGRLIDPYGGFDDIKDGKVRILHEKSFLDDPTRILRAVRFEQRFDFRIESKTLRLLKEAIKMNVFKSISAQRYAAEFKKILNEKDVYVTLKRLSRLGGLREISETEKLPWPKLKVLQKNILKGQIQINPEIDTQIKQWFLYWLCIAGNFSRKEISRLLKKFSFTKEEQKALAGLPQVKETMKFLSGKKVKRSDVYSLLKGRPLPLAVYAYLTADNKMIKNRIKKFLNADIYANLDINGDDLKQMGVHSGEKIGQTLKKCLLVKIDKGIKSKREELRVAREILQLS
ncbi:MAG TPA: CCA tRNA nucleotidyltransferase, partial [Candidatus Omnitrophota bacterium]|nr:CCA tRNA nucleotidyltransferase [Candidatus Omnitrophota bacterium]